MIHEEKPVRLLLVEDDLELANYLREKFSERGCEMRHAADVKRGKMAATKQNYDVYIVDRMLPDGDGHGWLAGRRQAEDHTPAIFLTALGSITDKVSGLSIADDYLVKPFEFEELWARVQALIRRPRKPPLPETIVLNGLTINRLNRIVVRDGVQIVLKPMEYKLLDYFISTAGQVVTRRMLLESVWGFYFEPSTNIVETYVSRLRAKIGQEGVPSVIETVRGEGYRFILS